jgi:hypothetical protein
MTTRRRAGRVVAVVGGSVANTSAQHNSALTAHASDARAARARQTETFRPSCFNAFYRRIYRSPARDAEHPTHSANVFTIIAPNNVALHRSCTAMRA